MSEHYHTDTNAWICSYSAFLCSPYFICKHLVKKYFTQHLLFFSQFLKTTLRHDYPLISFGISLQRINLINNLWDNTQYSDTTEPQLESDVTSSHSPSIIVFEYHVMVENRKMELISDMKAFETLVNIMNNNIENDRLYETYKTLRQPLIDEITTCNEVLRARTQQQTFKPLKKEKLAFWLQ
ncbi:12829_t:CDS:1 [Dentiscutata heterogama]|uniref:12829_t:CDS:1 n=1 Tax=Dentiscutata heterogama TaxID=1316150 RepID=A0ACA9NZI9_9GLOM|nr:12829_t:CDS:1 [Dentiscutata heterogama]